ncbi:P-loop containing nucleoside triphosphate hydrolase protein [Crepidotus variabilis]|uniref:P-loop containing nucleoside triphosphate hydrolase protein n=1 Tax=Crepidotus variabilis TaxID=179855 RepID=A0A9P6EI13_9AGAR|nr:P-loop containing nucleoside triphosphate hydrolase protein [Crepidotus variabilis]
MPAFQAPATNKRKLENDYEVETSRKRLNAANTQAEEVWMVQWRTPQNKKHKTWDGDGVLVVTNQGSSTLYDSDGRIMGTGKVTLPLLDGKSLSIGGKDLELDCAIPKGQFLSGACFGQGVRGENPVTANLPAQPTRQFKTPSYAPARNENKLNEISDTPSSSQQLSTPDKAPFDITNLQNHWSANWRKPQERKNKTWDGDSFVSLVNNDLVMVSEKGKSMGSTTWNGQPLQSGYSIYIGGKQVQLDEAVPVSRIPNSTKPFMQSKVTEEELVETEISCNDQAKRFMTPASFYASPKPKVKKARHDPDAPGALVLKAPNKDHIKRFNKRNLPVVPVVVDPILSARMRPHQREGVQFLYECVMGMRKHEGQGAILADEMGLGKTLQTIALVWTLIRQNPYAGPSPAVQKVLIVCPVSLINNWKAEFHKWLGRDRVGIVACDKNSSSIDSFGHSKVHEVLIIGYERLRTVVDKLSNIYPPIGLIICDEGHRLKSANNKTSNMFKSLSTVRRIILSGTPIQNDLGEFHAMAEFCNPGLLDDYSVFRKVYEVPILKSRAPEASPEEIDIGEGRSTQLLSIAKSFVLRRDATLLKNHLPPKTEYVVFITPTTLQSMMFTKILNPSHLDDLIQGSTAESLALINVLTKISNSPILLKATADSAKGKQDTMSRRSVQEALRYLPGGADVADMTLSGKLVLLARILKRLRQGTEEKCVLVSHYTSTLNILEAYCKKKSYSYYRLDGQTPQNKRQDYVNAFNKGDQRNSFVFLLSSKAGGVGINLIGASRLFIIDSDWNPSHDLQSMARCHRDGQKRPVFIYRLLTAGTIDEKIYQRQVTKLGLSDSLMGSGPAGSKSDSFTRKDLRDIFRVHADTPCNTHDLLQCNCDNDVDSSKSEPLPEPTKPKVLERTSSKGFIAASEVMPDDVDPAEQDRKREGLAALAEWKHLYCLRPDARESVQDDILRKSCTNGDARSKSIESSDTLLDRIDLDSIQSLDVPPIQDVPGGTISFVFEKLSSSTKDNAEEAV